MIRSKMQNHSYYQKIKSRVRPSRHLLIKHYLYRKKLLHFWNKTADDIQVLSKHLFEKEKEYNGRIKGKLNRSVLLARQYLKYSKLDNLSRYVYLSHLRLTDLELLAKVLRSDYPIGEIKYDLARKFKNSYYLRAVLLNNDSDLINSWFLLRKINANVANGTINANVSMIIELNSAHLEKIDGLYYWTNAGVHEDKQIIEWGKIIYYNKTEDDLLDYLRREKLKRKRKSLENLLLPQLKSVDNPRYDLLFFRLLERFYQGNAAKGKFNLQYLRQASPKAKREYIFQFSLKDSTKASRINYIRDQIRTKVDGSKLVLKRAPDDLVKKVDKFFADDHVDRYIHIDRPEISEELTDFTNKVIEDLLDVEGSSHITLSEIGSVVKLLSYDSNKELFMAILNDWEFTELLLERLEFKFKVLGLEGKYLKDVLKLNKSSDDLVYLTEKAAIDDNGRYHSDVEVINPDGTILTNIPPQFNKIMFTKRGLVLIKKFLDYKLQEEMYLGRLNSKDLAKFNNIITVKEITYISDDELDKYYEEKEEDKVEENDGKYGLRDFKIYEEERFHYYPKDDKLIYLKRSDEFKKKESMWDRLYDELLIRELDPVEYFSRESNRHKLNNMYMINLNGNIDPIKRYDLYSIEGLKVSESLAYYFVSDLNIRRYLRDNPIYIPLPELPDDDNLEDEIDLNEDDRLLLDQIDDDIDIGFVFKHELEEEEEEEDVVDEDRPEYLSKDPSEFKLKKDDSLIELYSQYYKDIKYSNSKILYFRRLMFFRIAQLLFDSLKGILHSDDFVDLILVLLDEKSLTLKEYIIESNRKLRYSSNRNQFQTSKQFRDYKKFLDHYFNQTNYSSDKISRLRMALNIVFMVLLIRTYDIKEGIFEEHPYIRQNKPLRKDLTPSLIFNSYKVQTYRFAQFRIFGREYHYRFLSHLVSLHNVASNRLNISNDILKEDLKVLENMAQDLALMDFLYSGEKLENIFSSNSFISQGNFIAHNLTILSKWSPRQLKKVIYDKFITQSYKILEKKMGDNIIYSMREPRYKKIEFTKLINQMPHLRFNRHSPIEIIKIFSYIDKKKFKSQNWWLNIFNRSNLIRLNPALSYLTSSIFQVRRLKELQCAEITSYVHSDFFRSSAFYHLYNRYITKTVSERYIKDYQKSLNFAKFNYNQTLEYLLNNNSNKVELLYFALLQYQLNRYYQDGSSKRLSKNKELILLSSNNLKKEKLFVLGSAAFTGLNIYQFSKEKKHNNKYEYLDHILTHIYLDLENRGHIFTLSVLTNQLDYNNDLVSAFKLINENVSSVSNDSESELIYEVDPVYYNNEYHNIIFNSIKLLGSKKHSYEPEHIPHLLNKEFDLFSINITGLTLTEFMDQVKLYLVQHAYSIKMREDSIFLMTISYHDQAKYKFNPLSLLYKIDAVNKSDQGIPLDRYINNRELDLSLNPYESKLARESTEYGIMQRSRGIPYLSDKYNYRLNDIEFRKVVGIKYEWKVYDQVSLNMKYYMSDLLYNFKKDDSFIRYLMKDNDYRVMISYKSEGNDKVKGRGIKYYRIEDLTSPIIRIGEWELDDNKIILNYWTTADYGNANQVFVHRSLGAYEYSIINLEERLNDEYYPIGRPNYLCGITDLSKVFGLIYAKISVPYRFRPQLPFRLFENNKITYPYGTFEGLYFSEELKRVYERGYKIEIIYAIHYNKAKIFSDSKFKGNEMMDIIRRAYTRSYLTQELDRDRAKGQIIAILNNKLITSMPLRYHEGFHRLYLSRYLNEINIHNENLFNVSLLPSIEKDKLRTVTLDMLTSKSKDINTKNYGKSIMLFNLSIIDGVKEVLTNPLKFNDGGDLILSTKIAFIVEELRSNQFLVPQKFKYIRKLPSFKTVWVLIHKDPEFFIRKLTINLFVYLSAQGFFIYLLGFLSTQSIRVRYIILKNWRIDYIKYVEQLNLLSKEDISLEIKIRDYLGPKYIKYYYKLFEFRDDYPIIEDKDINLSSIEVELARVRLSKLEEESKLLYKRTVLRHSLGGTSKKKHSEINKAQTIIDKNLFKKDYDENCYHLNYSDDKTLARMNILKDNFKVNMNSYNIDVKRDEKFKLKFINHDRILFSFPPRLIDSKLVLKNLPKRASSISMKNYNTINIDDPLISSVKEYYDNLSNRLNLDSIVKPSLFEINKYINNSTLSEDDLIHTLKLLQGSKAINRPYISSNIKPIMYNYKNLIRLKRLELSHMSFKYNNSTSPLSYLINGVGEEINGAGNRLELGRLNDWVLRMHNSLNNDRRDIILKDLYNGYILNDIGYQLNRAKTLNNINYKNIILNKRSLNYLIENKDFSYIGDNEILRNAIVDQDSYDMLTKYLSKDWPFMTNYEITVKRILNKHILGMVQLSSSQYEDYRVERLEELWKKIEGISNLNEMYINLARALYHVSTLPDYYYLLFIVRHARQYNLLLEYFVYENNIRNSTYDSNLNYMDDKEEPHEEARLYLEGLDGSIKYLVSNVE